MVLLSLEGVLECAAQAFDYGAVGISVVVLVQSVQTDLRVGVVYPENIFVTACATVELGGPRDWLDIMRVPSVFV